MNGVDVAIIDRSEELVRLSTCGEDLVAACATLTPNEEEDLRLAVRPSMRVHCVSTKTRAGGRG